MKKFNQLLTLIAICILFISCDTGFHCSGVVVDQKTHQPIKEVRISIKDRDTTFTDSLGRFQYSKMIYGWAGNLDILLEKDGYKTKFVSFAKGKMQPDNAVIELEKANGTSGNSIDRKYIKTMFYFNKYVLSLLNVLTLLFVALNRKIKYRLAWIAGILLLNFTFFITFTDGSLVNFCFLNGPVYLSYFSMNPYSLKFVLPVATIIFWVIYLSKRKWILKEIEATESTK